MAFAWVYEANWERGDLTDWDTASTSDTASQLDVLHYSDMARFPWSGMTPHTGAYSLAAVLSGGTGDAHVLEADINVAAAATRWFRWAIWFSPSFDATANDTVSCFELEASGTTELSVGFRYVAATDVINMGIGETNPTAFGTENIEKGVWYTVEVSVTVDTGTNDNGTASLYVTRAGAPAKTTADASVSSLNQGAVTDGTLGVQDHLATTTGTIMFDDFIMDDARIGPTKRYAEERRLTQSGHLFVGPGRVMQVTLHSGGAADNLVELFDTDQADVTQAPRAILSNGTAAETVQGEYSSAPLFFTKGCYVRLGGTNPEITASIRPLALSDANVRRYGLARNTVPSAV